MQGRGQMIAGAETREVGPGTLVFVPPATPHAIRTIGDAAAAEYRRLNRAALSGQHRAAHDAAAAAMRTSPLSTPMGAT